MTSAAVAPVQPQRSKRPRAGRPTAARASRIDGQIRAAARKLFLELGFETASMDLVAREADVSKGTLYARFASKDMLLLAVIDDLLGQLHTKASADDHSLPAALAPKLKEYARRLLHAMNRLEYRQFVQLTQSAARSDPGLSRSWQDAAMAGYVEGMARAIEASAPSTRADPDYWQHLARMLVYAITGWQQAECGLFPLDDERFDTYCDVVVGAITASIRNRQTAASSD